MEKKTRIDRQKLREEHYFNSNRNIAFEEPRKAYLKRQAFADLFSIFVGFIFPVASLCLGKKCDLLLFQLQYSKAQSILKLMNLMNLIMIAVECAGFVLGVIYGFYYVVYSSRYLFSLVCTLLFLIYVAICLNFNFSQMKDYREFSSVQDDQIETDALEEKYDEKTEELLM